MTKVALTISFFCIAAMVGISYYGWTEIPPDTLIASHWDSKGQVNGVSPRNNILIGLPIVAAFVTTLFWLIPKIDPRTDHVRQTNGLLLVGWLGALGVLLVAHASIVFSAAHEITNPLSSKTVLYAVCALLVITGNFTAKSRSNFFLGIRTPWTLSSEHAWNVTNRAGGWMLVLTGIGTAAGAALESEELGSKILMAGVATTVVASFAISYMAWRGDPERREA